MSPQCLIAWRSRLGFSQEEAAYRMGISRRQYIRYETGEAVIPRLVELACQALSAE